MFEAAYRKRLNTDLARWQSDGVITLSIGDAIRAKLGPPPKSVNIATVVGIVGALLIAAAFLAFVAANWTVIARPTRFVVLLAGIALAYAFGAWFDRQGRAYLADICATVGSIVFGAAIALTGQMYHLSGDFAAGVMLWAGGALVAAALTGSRGALAVALATGCLWSGMRMFEAGDVPHLPFIAFWLAGAGLALAWNAPTARHLVALAAFAWWTQIALTDTSFFRLEPIIVGAAGGALMLGAGLTMASFGAQSSRSLGQTLATYGALAFVVVVTLTIVGILDGFRSALPAWVAACAVAGLILAFVAAAISRLAAPAIAGVAIGLGLAIAGGYTGAGGGQEQWLTYSLSLIAMLSLIVSGMLDNVRPRVVAGWLGMAAAIGTITWALQGSLLMRAVFLAAAGAIAVALAVLLGRFKFKESGA
jgi:uncharacterized membrane protein